MRSDAEAFRKRAQHCRDVAGSTKDARAQRELCDLARELDAEADKIDAEDQATLSDD